MQPPKSSFPSCPLIIGWLIIFGMVTLVLLFPICAGISLRYTESKGPFKNATQVVDLDSDGDYDVLVSHTRWAGVGRESFLPPTSGR